MKAVFVNEEQSHTDLSNEVRELEKLIRASGNRDAVQEWEAIRDEIYFSTGEATVWRDHRKETLERAVLDAQAIIEDYEL